jgi:tellurite resistance protein TerC
MFPEFLMALWLGMPVWVWLAFIGVVLAILAFDLGVMHRDAHEIGVRESLNMSALYIGLGLAWAAAVYWIYFTYSGTSSIDPQIAAAASPGERAWTAVQLYITGYLVEKTLALDNVFIISMIFTYFAVPREYQHRVLFWGILGVIVLRAIMIGLGAALVMEFAWVMYFFAVILVATGIKMIVMMYQKPDISNNPVLKFMRKHLRVTETMHGQRFWVRQPDPKTGKVVLWATPLFLCLVLVEIADLVFAIDSVPAIFAITPDAFIVYTSNIFAILGLRALYFALAAVVHRFHYLKYALALVLIFIGAKIFAGDFLFDGKVPAWLSLSVTAGMLAGGILYSLWKTRGGTAEPGGPAPGGLVPPSGGNPRSSGEPLRVSDARAPALVTVSAQASLSEAAALMVSARVPALVVLDERGQTAGIVTEGDLVRRAALAALPDSPLWRTLFNDDRTLAAAFARAHGQRVDSVMSRDVHTTDDEAPLAEAAQLLFRHSHKAMPVLSGGRPVGLLTRTDVVAALSRLLAQPMAQAASDEEIRKGLAQRLSHVGWVSPLQMSWRVTDGRVDLEGTLSSAEQRRALLALAEGVPGVRAVVDRLQVAPGLPTGAAAGV